MFCFLIFEWKLLKLILHPIFNFIVYVITYISDFIFLIICCHFFMYYSCVLFYFLFYFCRLISWMSHLYNSQLKASFKIITLITSWINDHGWMDWSRYWIFFNDCVLHEGLFVFFFHIYWALNSLFDPIRISTKFSFNPI